MTDQCKHCTLRGDIKACKATPCSKHEDWYVVQLQQENTAYAITVQNLEAEIAKLKEKRLSKAKSYHHLDKRLIKAMAENTALKAEVHAKEIEELEDIELEDIDLNDFEQLKANLNKIKADAIREMVGENLTIARLRNDKKRSFVFASDAMEYANNLEGKK